MKLWKIFFIFILVGSVSGCAGSVDLRRDEKGRITGIDSFGNIKASGKTEKEEWSVDNKTESPLKDVVNIQAQKIVND